jgi:sulfite exporter TauE/SafE
MPCGLVYSVLLVAAAAGSAARGGVLLLAFGLGTLPAMLGLAQLGGRLVRADGSLVRLVGAVIVACGLWTAAVPLAELNGASPHHHRGLETMPSRSGPVSTTTDAKTSTAALVSRRK